MHELWFMLRHPDEQAISSFSWHDTMFSADSYTSQYTTQRCEYLLMNEWVSNYAE